MNRSFDELMRGKYGDECYIKVYRKKLPRHVPVIHELAAAAETLYKFTQV